jgi:zinc protease
MGGPGMSRRDPDYFSLYVGNHILGGGGLVSRLNEEIREKRGLSYSVYSYFSPMRRKGPYVLGLQTRNDQVGQALEIARETVKRFIKEGPTAEELEAAKKNITGGFPLRIDSNAEIVEYIAMIGFYGLPLDYLDTFSANVEAVTREQIRDAFRRRVVPDRMVTVVVGGNETGDVKQAAQE